MTYTVKKGDNLSRIAVAHGCKVADIVALNKIKNPNLITVGQVLILPDPKGGKDIKTALNKCLEAVENLPEYKELQSLL